MPKCRKCLVGGKCFRIGKHYKWEIARHLVMASVIDSQHVDDLSKTDPRLKTHALKMAHRNGTARSSAIN